MNSRSIICPIYKNHQICLKECPFAHGSYNLRFVKKCSIYPLCHLGNLCSERHKRKISNVKWLQILEMYYSKENISCNLVFDEDYRPKPPIIKF